jgi:hypothetical protein
VVGFSFLVAVVAMLVVLAGVLTNPISLGDWGTFELSTMTGMTILTPALCVALVVFCVMLPLLITAVALLGLLFNREAGRVFYGVTVGIWLAALLFCIVVAIANAGWLHQQIMIN